MVSILSESEGWGFEHDLISSNARMQPDRMRPNYEFTIGRPNQDDSFNNIKELQVALITIDSIARMW